MKRFFMILGIILMLPFYAVQAENSGRDPWISDRLAAGAHHALAILSDGSVAAAGENEDGQCNVQHWEDIVQVAAGEGHSAGLKKDGTVVAAGRNDQGQCNVDSWTDIVFIACGDEHTVGLKKDGTVVFTGIREYIPGYMNPSVDPGKVDAWRDVVMLTAGGYTTFAIDKNGRVLVAGELADEPLEWENMERRSEGLEQLPYKTLDEMPRQIAVMGRELLLYLYDDGTVGYDGLGLRLYPEEWGMCAECHPGIDRWSDFGTHTATLWTDIVALYTSNRFVIGLKKDGTVQVAGSEITVDSGGVNIHAVEKWKNIVSIAAGDDFAIGVDSFGKMYYHAQPDGDLSGVALWEDVDAAAASQGFAAGIAKDGKGIAWSAEEMLWRFGDDRAGCAAWQDVVSLSVSDSLAAGIDQRGRLLLSGYHDYTENDFSTLEQRGPIRRAALHDDQVLLLTEQGEVFFFGREDDLSALAGAREIALNQDWIVALMEDGRVKTAANGDVSSQRYDPSKEMEAWQDIQSIAIGGDVIYGLTRDGRVVMTENAVYGQQDAKAWEGIIAISASPYHIAGLKADGTVVAAGQNEDTVEEDWGEMGTKNQCEVGHWRNVKQVIAATGGTIGICYDGSVLYAGAGYADVSACFSWRLFDGEYVRRDGNLKTVSARLVVISQRKAINDLYARQTLDFLRRENAQGQAILRMHPEYDKVYTFHNGYAMVEKDGLYGLVNEAGEEMLPPVHPFMNRAYHAVIYTDPADSLYGFFVEDTGVLIPPAFKAAQDFEGNYVKVMLPDESEWYVSRQGERISEKEYKALQLPAYQKEKSSLSLYVLDDYWESFEGAYGYTDEAGNIVIDPIFQLAWEFEEGLARVNLWGYEGCINEQGEIVCGFDGLEERLTGEK